MQNYCNSVQNILFIFSFRKKEQRARSIEEGGVGLRQINGVLMFTCCLKSQNKAIVAEEESHAFKRNLVTKMY